MSDALNPKDQALFVKLQNESGARFDKLYVRAMVTDHKTDLKAFRKEAAKGKDQALKDFAQQGLPVLEGHLQRAEGIRAKLR